MDRRPESAPPCIYRRRIFHYGSVADRINRPNRHSIRQQHQKSITLNKRRAERSSTQRITVPNTKHAESEIKPTMSSNDDRQQDYAGSSQDPDDWKKITDPKERRMAQNRISQRKYRK